MSTYYTVRLRKFSKDDGFTGGERDLKVLARKTTEDLTIAVREASLNDTGTDNLLRKVEEEVIFDVSPTVSESRQASYSDEGLPSPSGIVVFRTLSNRRYSVSSRMVSRNLIEAEKNFKNINLLRSWMIPQSTGTTGSFGRPPILRLNGYKEQFFNIPVVLSNLTINYPEDIDYIESDHAMVPIIQTVDFELIETHKTSSLSLSAAQVSEESGLAAEMEFNLDKFKQGRLPGY